MKKILLSLVLVIAGLVAMAQEETATPERSEMVRKYYRLCFVQGADEVVISDEDLEHILDIDVCNEYYTGKALYRVGDGIITGSWTAIGFGVGLFIPGVLLGSRSGSETVTEFAILMVTAGVSGFFEGLLSLPAGYALRTVGVKKIKGIVEGYNLNNQKTAVHYQFAPSVMPVNIPQSQGHMAYGMTFSISF